MANELAISLTFTYTNPAGNVQSNTFALTDSVSVTLSNYERNVQTVTTSKAALSLGVVTPGQVVLRNADATNTINVFANSSATQATISLAPGQFCLFPVASGAVLNVQSVAGSPKLEYYAVSA